MLATLKKSESTSEVIQGKTSGVSSLFNSDSRQSIKHYLDVLDQHPHRPLESPQQFKHQPKNTQYKERSLFKNVSFGNLKGEKERRCSGQEKEAKCYYYLMGLSSASLSQKQGIKNKQTELENKVAMANKKMAELRQMLEKRRWEKQAIVFEGIVHRMDRKASQNNQNALLTNK